MGLSSGRESRVPCVADVRVAVGALFVSFGRYRRPCFLERVREASRSRLCASNVILTVADSTCRPRSAATAGSRLSSKAISDTEMPGRSPRWATWRVHACRILAWPSLVFARAGPAPQPRPFQPPPDAPSSTIVAVSLFVSRFPRPPRLSGSPVLAPHQGLPRHLDRPFVGFHPLRHPSTRGHPPPQGPPLRAGRPALRVSSRRVRQGAVAQRVIFWPKVVDDLDG